LRAAAALAAALRPWRVASAGVFFDTDRVLLIVAADND
jgi:hypothetical protein